MAALLTWQLSISWIRVCAKWQGLRERTTRLRQRHLNFWWEPQLLDSFDPAIISACNKTKRRLSDNSCKTKLETRNQMIWGSNNQCLSLHAAQCMQKDGLGIFFSKIVNSAPIAPHKSSNWVSAPSCKWGMWQTCRVGLSAPLGRDHECRQKQPQVSSGAGGDCSMGWAEEDRPLRVSLRTKGRQFLCLRIFHVQSSKEIWWSLQSKRQCCGTLLFLFVHTWSSQYNLAKDGHRLQTMQLSWSYRQSSLKQFIASSITFCSCFSICDWK